MPLSFFPGGCTREEEFMVIQLQLLPPGSLGPQDSARPPISAQSPNPPRSGPLSLSPNFMIAQDAFRAGLALVQRVVPFDVARVRQLLAGTMR